MTAKQTRKRRLRDMIRGDKEQMLPLNFALSYIITPIYVVVAILLVNAFGTLVEGESVTGSLVCIGALALLTVVFLALFPYARKRAIETELKRYDLPKCLRKRDQMASREEWDFSEKELSIRFNRYGMVLDDELRYYNHFDKLVYTMNDHRRIGIFICFSDNADSYILLPLNAKTLKMLDDFDVTLDNQPVLDYILSHPQEAFTDIYKTGKVSLPQQEKKES